MIEPIIKFHDDNSVLRLVKYLEAFNQREVLTALAEYSWLSFQYDVKHGTIEIKFYSDRFAAPAKIFYLMVDSKIDRYSLWQYFYQPEHRSDWES